MVWTMRNWELVGRKSYKQNASLFLFGTKNASLLTVIINNIIYRWKFNTK